MKQKAIGSRGRNVGVITQGNDASSIPNHRGLARRAKRQSSKIRRQTLRKIDGQVN